MSNALRLPAAESSLLDQIMGNDEAIRAQFRAMQAAPTVVITARQLTVKEQEERQRAVRGKGLKVTAAEAFLGMEVR